MYIQKKSSNHYELIIDNVLKSKGTFNKVNRILDSIVKLLPPVVLYNEDGSIFNETIKL
jgi:hypothetical protein